MLIRIQTARDEMDAIREFDYGEPSIERRPANEWTPTYTSNAC